MSRRAHATSGHVPCASNVLIGSVHTIGRRRGGPPPGRVPSPGLRDKPGRELLIRGVAAEVHQRLDGVGDEGAGLALVGERVRAGPLGEAARRREDLRLDDARAAVVDGAEDGDRAAVLADVADCRRRGPPPRGSSLRWRRGRARRSAPPARPCPVREAGELLHELAGPGEEENRRDLEHAVRLRERQRLAVPSGR